MFNDSVSRLLRGKRCLTQAGGWAPLNSINGSAAVGRATSAQNFWTLAAKTVVRRQFLPRFNRPYALDKDVILSKPVLHVRAATVIDDLGPAATYRSVNGPHPVKFDRVGFLAILDPPAALLRSNDLPDVLNHVAPSRDGLCREHAPTVDAGFGNFQTAAGIAEIDARFCSSTNGTIRLGTRGRQQPEFLFSSPE